MPSKHFHELIEECKKIHDKKSHDYAKDNDPFSNFKRAAELASWFNNDNDKIFTCLIGIKLARLAELLDSVGNKSPKNEPIKDSFIDLANYCLLWGSSYLQGLESVTTEKLLIPGIPGHQHNFNVYSEINKNYTCSCGAKLPLDVIMNERPYKSIQPFVCNGCGRQFQDRDPITTNSGFYCSIACQYPMKENA